MAILAVSELGKPDYFILVGYFVLMLGIGVYFYRYMRGMKDYFSGGNRIPWWLSGVSFYMSCFSAFAFISYSAMAYKYGLPAVVLFSLKSIAVIVSVVFFAKRWRRARIDSPVEYLEGRYSPVVRQLFAWQGIPVRVIDDALKLVAIGFFVSTAFKLNLSRSILWSGLIMLAYTMMGGLWAVAVTDFVQFVIMIVAVIVLIPLSFRETGGIVSFIENAPAGFFKAACSEYSLFYIFCMLLMLTFAYSSVNWSLIQRYYCVPKERDAYKVGWLVVVLVLVTMPAILMPAMAGRVHLPGISDADSGQIYPMLCLKLLPVGMIGLVIAAMFSATMSMLSSDYNVCASVLTNDVYLRIIRPGASARELVFVGRVMTVVVGIIPIGIALWMGRVSGENLFRNMLKLFSVATAPVAIPMMLGLLFKKMNNKGTLSGFFGGIGVGLLIFLLYPDKVELMGVTLKVENLLLIVTTGVTLSVSIIVSLVFPAKEAERERADTFLSKLDVPIGQMPEDDTSRPQRGIAAVSPFRVVGICILCIAFMIMGIMPFVDSRFAFYLELIFVVSFLVIGGLMVFAGRRRRAAEGDNG